MTQTRLENIEVEPSNRIDVRATLDGRSIIFEIKSLYSFASNYQKMVNNWTKFCFDVVLNKPGRFIKMVFSSSPQNPRIINPFLLEYRKVSNTLDPSYGVLYFDINSLQWSTFGRLKGAIRTAYVQHKESGGRHRIVAIDTRYEALNEAEAYDYVFKTLCRKRYEKLSGVVLMTFDLQTSKSTAKTKLLPVRNPHTVKPIDWRLMFKGNVRLVRWGKQYLLALPTRIRIPSPGWHDLIHMEPGYKIVYKGVEYGTL